MHDKINTSSDGKEKSEPKDGLILIFAALLKRARFGLEKFKVFRFFMSEGFFLCLKADVRCFKGAPGCGLW